MDRGRAHWTHFVQHDRNAPARQLPGGLTAGKPTADDVNRAHSLCHFGKLGRSPPHDNLAGMWALAYDRPVEPLFFVIVVILQIGRFWVLATLGHRWTIRIIVVPGEKLVARGPYQ